MVNNCTICGAELVDGKCPSVHAVKPMCLNCIYVTDNGSEYRCVNEDVLDGAKQKYTMDKTKVIRTLLEPSGLGIEDIEME